jgi:putative ABC transport system ATP-binding protein
VLVLGELFDTMPDSALRRSLDLLQQAQTTVIYFSSRTHDLGFDRFLYLGYEQQRVFDSYAEFCSMLGSANFDSRGGAPAPAT